MPTVKSMIVYKHKTGTKDGVQADVVHVAKDGRYYVRIGGATVDSRSTLSNAVEVMNNIVTVWDATH